MSEVRTVNRRCRYKRESGFRDDRDYPWGTLLQFVAVGAGGSGIRAIILPDLSSSPIAVPIADLRMEKPYDVEDIGRVDEEDRRD